MATAKTGGLRKVRLDQLDPNPYRHFETYPISKEKIKTLTESIGSTGFWGETVIARPMDSRFQIAFGHHRIEAAREKLGKSATVSISIRELDDSQMLSMMSRENNDVYRITADMDMEVVRAAIEGFAEGYIDLPAPAPSRNQKENVAALSPEDFGFRCTDSTQRKFTRKGIATLLGISDQRVAYAIRNLKLTNEKITTSKQYQGLKHDQAAVMSTAVDKVRRTAGEGAARKAADRISKAIKEKDKLEGGAGRHPSRTIAKQIADEEIAKVKPPELPDINDVSERVGKSISDFMSESKMAKTLAEICKHKDALDSVHRRSLVSKLNTIEQTAAKYRAELEADSIRRVK